MNDVKNNNKINTYSIASLIFAAIGVLVLISVFTLDMPRNTAEDIKINYFIIAFVSAVALLMCGGLLFSIRTIIFKKKSDFAKAARNSKIAKYYAVGNFLFFLIILVLAALPAVMVVSEEKNRSDALLRAAEYGDAAALNSLADIYIKGGRLPTDMNGCVSIFQKAAENGNATAQRTVGIIFAEGLGVKKDVAKGVEWLKKAKTNGDFIAENLLIDYENKN